MMGNKNAYFGKQSLTVYHLMFYFFYTIHWYANELQRILYILQLRKALWAEHKKPNIVLGTLSYFELAVARSLNKLNIN